MSATVINPRTGRAVKVGSRIWTQLVNEGLIENDYDDPNELYEIQQNDEKDDIINMKNELNETLGPSVQAVKGRGKYKDKLVARKKAPSKLDTIKYTAKVATTQMKNIKQDDLNDDEITAMLSQLIAKEMMISGRPERKPKTQYNTEESEEEEYYE